MAKPELAALPETTFAALLRLCPRVGMAKGEAWFETDKAVAYVKEHPRSTIWMRYFVSAAGPMESATARQCGGFELMTTP